MSATYITRPLQNPRFSLLIFATLWKSLLFAIALASPGPGYDTSTTLLYPNSKSRVIPFVRWDAIYFTQTAQRGYIFEQEWAFSWALTRVMAFVAGYLRKLGISPIESEPWAGILIANVSHILAVVLLFELTLLVFRRRPDVLRFAFISACLHVVSPAGLFLSAPYSESPFALLHFLAYYLYAHSVFSDRVGAHARRDALLVASGALIGLSTAVRSNGLVSGLLFAYDALDTGSKLLQGDQVFPRLRKLVVVVLSGSLVALGSAIPQAVAYIEYCTVPSITTPPWCDAMPPSIYTYVQSHYWNVGFLRYWTISNIPLFLLAAPMLFIMSISTIWAFNSSSVNTEVEKGGPTPETPNLLLPLFAAPQAILVLITLTTSHVQIVTRLSSGYPAWYWWLASWLIERSSKSERSTLLSPKAVVRWMMIYAVIQGGLFASFLPPA